MLFFPAPINIGYSSETHLHISHVNEILEKKIQENFGKYLKKLGKKNRNLKPIRLEIIYPILYVCQSLHLLI